MFDVGCIVVVVYVQFVDYYVGLLFGIVQVEVFDFQVGWQQVGEQCVGYVYVWGYVDLYDQCFVFFQCMWCLWFVVGGVLVVFYVKCMVVWFGWVVWDVGYFQVGEYWWFVLWGEVYVFGQCGVVDVVVEYVVCGDGFVFIVDCQFIGYQFFLVGCQCFVYVCQCYLFLCVQLYIVVVVVCIECVVQVDGLCVVCWFGQFVFVQQCDYQGVVVDGVVVVVEVGWMVICVFGEVGCDCGIVVFMVVLQ